MESHLYDCMAAIALTHNFTWSRWNFMSGRRSCVLLMREIIENRKTVRDLLTIPSQFVAKNFFNFQPTHSTLHVTPLKASIIDCTDVSPCFNPVGVEGMEVCTEIFHGYESDSLNQIISSSMPIYINYPRLIHKPCRSWNSHKWRHFYETMWSKFWKRHDR